MSNEVADWESKDIYLKKTGEDGFIGLHSVGDYDDQGKWMNLEAWANMYDTNKKFVGSIFRIFGPIEDVMEEYLKDGWEVVKDFEVKT